MTNLQIIQAVFLLTLTVLMVLLLVGSFFITLHRRRGRAFAAVAPGMVDIQQIPLYDTFTIPTNTPIVPPVQFFTVPIGQTGSGFTTAKNSVQTNLTDPQRLPAPRSFEVHAVRLYWKQDIIFADVLNSYGQLNLVLIVGEKVYQQGPLWMFPAGGGVTGNPAVALYDQAAPTQVQFTNWQNGECNPCAINVIAQPFIVRIEQGENFRVELQGTTGFTTSNTATYATGITFVCVLDGILTRQVQ